MTTATLLATPKPSGDTMTGIRINRAMTQPGAKGKKGVLLWVAAAFPKPIVDKVMKAALTQVDPMMLSTVMGQSGAPLPSRAGPTVTKMGRFGGFGDDANLVTIGVDTPSVSDSTQAAINATDSGAASPDWAATISSAINAAGQAYLTKAQVDTMSQIAQQNILLAQKGLPLIPTNPTTYGLPAPTVQLGLASSTLTPLLYVVGGIGALFLVMHLSKSHRTR